MKKIVVTLFYFVFCLIFLSCEEEKSTIESKDFKISDDKKLGALKNTAPSAFDLEGLSAISIKNTTASSQSVVDIVLHSENQEVTFLYSPSNTIFNGTSNVGVWTKRNQTKIKYLQNFTVDQWNEANSAQKIQDVYNTSAATESDGNIISGKNTFYAFKTVNSKYAIIYIKEFTVSDTGSIVFNTKVQL